MAVMFEFSVISQCVGPQTCVVAMVATTGIGDFTIASLDNVRNLSDFGGYTSCCKIGFWAVETGHLLL